MRGPRKPPFRFRWVSPDGRKGRWHNTRLGAETSAVNARFTVKPGGVTVHFCRRSAYAMWSSLEKEGWEIEMEKVAR